MGKDGGCGQRERNASLLGEVHRRHDGAPSLSGERRRREGHHVSLPFYFASYIIMDILMNLLILFTFYSLLQGIYPEDTASAAGEEETASASKKMGGDVGGGNGSAAEEVRGKGGRRGGRQRTMAAQSGGRRQRQRKRGGRQQRRQR